MGFGGGLAKTFRPAPRDVTVGVAVARLEIQPAQ